MDPCVGTSDSARRLKHLTPAPFVCHPLALHRCVPPKERRSKGRRRKTTNYQHNIAGHKTLQKFHIKMFFTRGVSPHTCARVHTHTHTHEHIHTHARTNAHTHTHTPGLLSDRVIREACDALAFYQGTFKTSEPVDHILMLKWSV